MEMDEHMGAQAAKKDREELAAEVERLKAERAELGHIGASQYKAEVERLKAELANERAENEAYRTAADTDTRVLVERGEELDRLRAEVERLKTGGVVDEQAIANARDSLNSADRGAMRRVIEAYEAARAPAGGVGGSEVVELRYVLEERREAAEKMAEVMQRSAELANDALNRERALMAEHARLREACSTNEYLTADASTIRQMKVSDKIEAGAAFDLVRYFYRTQAALKETSAGEAQPIEVEPTDNAYCQKCGAGGHVCLKCHPEAAPKYASSIEALAKQVGRHEGVLRLIPLLFESLRDVSGYPVAANRQLMEGICMRDGEVKP